MVVVKLHNVAPLRSNITTTDALSRIRAYYNSLSTSERKVADFILENFESVAGLSLAELAKNSGVSDATAVRFCRSIGCNGYFELKVALAQAVADSSTLVYEGVANDDTPIVIAQKVFNSCHQAIRDTLGVLTPECFGAALELISKADRILIIGVGTSSPVAHELHNWLFRLQLNCHVQTDASLQLMQAALLTHRDLLIAISQSGDTLYPVRSATVAHSHGCPIICITGNALSRLAALADVVLLSVSHEKRPETISSRVAQHALIQSLYVALSMRTLEKANAAEHAIWEALTTRPLPERL